MKTTQDLIQIVSNGGGLIIDASRTTLDLVQIASNVARGSRVIIKGAGNKTTQDLIQIASSGKGAVIFDFTV